MLDASGSDLGRAVGAGLLAALVMGALFVAYLTLLFMIPFGYIIGIVLGQVGVGYVVGEAVRRGGRYKVDKKLRYIAGVLAFLAYITSVAILLSVPQLNPGALSNIFGLVGMAISVYVAMGRLRP